MYSFDFVYADNKNKYFENIIKVVYSDIVEEHIVEGEAILSYKFPTNCNMSLYSKNENHSIDAKNLRSISITKED